jgi:hypothetical protein
MGWEIAITLGAIALLGLLHLAYSTAEGTADYDSAGSGERARRLTGGRDPWAVALVAAAGVAALFAIGVVAGPAIFDESEENAPSTTRPTVTTATTAVSSTTAPTTTRPTTTTRPPTTTTTPVGPPPGTVLIAETAVSESGQVLQSYSRLGSAPVVRAVDTGVYRVLLPGLRSEARKSVTLRVHAGAGTTAVARMQATSPAFVVMTRDAPTGEPAARRFLLEVYGPPAAARPAAKPQLPKTM